MPSGQFCLVKWHISYSKFTGKDVEILKNPTLGINIDSARWSNLKQTKIQVFLQKTTFFSEKISNA